jgi:hypothetical protein
VRAADVDDVDVFARDDILPARRVLLPAQTLCSLLDLYRGIIATFNFFLAMDMPLMCR